MKYTIQSPFPTIFAFATLCFSLFSANPALGQDTLKVMHYNLLFYGDCTGADLADKDVWLEDVAGFYQPDIFTVNEMSDRIAYANRIKSRSLTYGNMEYTEFTNNAGSNIVNMMFYNTDKLGYKGIQAIGINGLRDINVYTLYHKNSIQGNDTTFLDCIVSHFKAGSSSADKSQRNGFANDIMNWIDAQGPNYQNYLVMGDFNISNATESAWKTLVANSNPAINLVDPSGLANGWGAGTPAAMTQSTRSTGTGDCGVGGGLDDRFDFILTSNAIDQGAAGISMVPGSFGALGNNGTISFNGQFGCSGNPAIPSNVCNSLILMSDHLPMVMELTLANTTAVEPELAPFSLSGLENPFKGDLEFEIQWKEHLQTLSVSLHTPTGQLISTHLFSPTSDNQSIRIPTKDLSNGVYFLRIQPEKGVGISRKVIKIQR